jgi:hypothetical protein
MSALLWCRTPYRLLEAIQHRSDTQLYSSAALLEELIDVLARASATKRFTLTDKTIAEVARRLPGAGDQCVDAPIPALALISPDQAASDTSTGGGSLPRILSNSGKFSGADGRGVRPSR